MSAKPGICHVQQILHSFLFIGLIMSCGDGSKTIDPALELSRYQWMVGNWNLTSNPGIWERWEMDSTELRGVSMLIKGKDTSVLEEMKIRWKDTAFVFFADLPENEVPVEFCLTKREVNIMHFQNLEHDFPKYISYQKIGHNSLKAEVRGDNKSIKFLFVKR